MKFHKRLQWKICHRSRAHIQRCNGEADPTTAALIANPNDEDGCSLESGDIDEADSTQLETVGIYLGKLLELKR